MKVRRLVVLTAVLALSVVVVPFSLSDALRTASAASSEALAKIDPAVLNAVSSGGDTRFLVLLRDQADLTGASALATKAARTAFVFQALRATAARTQPAVAAALQGLGLQFEAFYVANMFVVEAGGREAILTLAARSDVAAIEADPAVRLQEPRREGAGPRSPGAVEWGVAKIRAPEVWAMGFTGQGIVYANQDTGMQWDHPALKRHYRGWSPAGTDHNYNWWDSIKEDLNGNGTNPCGFRVKKPCDDNSHGTHTTGTGVGDDGAGNQIGVAPGAKWIGCRNMEEGVGRPSTYIQCFEFFLAPWDRNKENPDPTKAADVVSNSWSCPIGPPPAGEDCTPKSIKKAVETVRAAGIFVAASAGNSGPACSTVNAPIAIHNATTTIGATDINDNLASFSSRGPVLVDGSNRRKPDISAPGVSVRSSVPTDAYASFSGTSMASPHMAGAVALLWSAVPSLRGNVDRTERIFFRTANPNVNAAGVCGGTGPGDIPNNLFGYGRVDALAAVQDAMPAAR